MGFGDWISNKLVDQLFGYNKSLSITAGAISLHEEGIAEVSWEDHQLSDEARVFAESGDVLTESEAPQFDRMYHALLWYGEILNSIAYRPLLSPDSAEKLHSVVDKIGTNLELYRFDPSMFHGWRLGESANAGPIHRFHSKMFRDPRNGVLLVRDYSTYANTLDAASCVGTMLEDVCRDVSLDLRVFFGTWLLETNEYIREKRLRSGIGSWATLASLCKLVHRQTDLELVSVSFGRPLLRNAHQIPGYNGPERAQITQLLLSTALDSLQAGPQT